MSLIRKTASYKPGDFQRISEVAELLRVDAESIRTGAVGNFTLIPLNDSKRPPLVIRTSEVTRFLDDRIKKAEKKGNQ